MTDDIDRLRRRLVWIVASLVLVVASVVVGFDVWLSVRAGDQTDHTVCAVDLQGAELAALARLVPTRPGETASPELLAAFAKAGRRVERVDKICG